MQALAILEEEVTRLIVLGESYILVLLKLVFFSIQCFSGKKTVERTEAQQHYVRR